MKKTQYAPHIVFPRTVFIGLIVVCGRKVISHVGEMTAIFAYMHVL